MAGSSKGSSAAGVGALLGVTVAAIAFLATQEITPLIAVVVPLTGVVSAALAFLVWRHTVDQWSTLWFLLGLAFTIPTAYRSFKWFQSRPDPQLATREYQGFSIGVPGEVKSSFTTEYDFGWSNHADPPHGVWATVGWGEGALDVDVATPDAAEAWLAGFGYDKPLTISENDKTFEWKDLATRSYKLYVGLERADLTFVACGKRLIAVYTSHGSRNDAVRVHRRTVGSIVCTPIAEEEVVVGTPPPVKTTVPEGWKPMPDVDPVWTVWGNGNAILIFMYFHRGHASLSDMKLVANDAIGHWGAVELSGSEKVGDIELWRGTLTDDEGEQTLLLHLTTCGARPMVALLFGFETVEEARAALLAARCEL